MGTSGKYSGIAATAWEGLGAKAKTNVPNLKRLTRELDRRIKTGKVKSATPAAMKGVMRDLDKALGRGFQPGAVGKRGAAPAAKKKGGGKKGGGKKGATPAAKKKGAAPKKAGRPAAKKKGRRRRGKKK